MSSILHTGPSIVVKVKAEDSFEQTVGYATALQYQVTQGQKTLYGVDSPFPQEIAQAAGPSFVRGTMVIFLPKGTNPELLGLVPYRQAGDQTAFASGSKYMNINLYNRADGTLIMSLNFCKVSGYSVNINSKSLITMNLSFEGVSVTPNSQL